VVHWSVVWGNCSNEGLNRIFKLQKGTARSILDQDPIAPSEPLFKQLGWMTIEQRIKYHQYLLVSKCLKNEAPVYLKNKIQYLSDRNPYSLRNVVSETNIDLAVPFCNLKMRFSPSFEQFPQTTDQCTTKTCCISDHSCVNK
jgi:hypothetical protein